MGTPKWKIKNLSGDYSLKKAGEIILKERIKNVSGNIKVYLKEENPAKLHDVRISIRRLRYNLELFYPLFDPKKFNKFYKILVNLQDSTGNVRDIYITFGNISLFKKEDNIVFTDQLIAHLKEKQKILIHDLNIQLTSFLKSNEMKTFIKLLR